jgi:hypothetical protein
MGRKIPMKTLSATYKGNRTLELSQDLQLPENASVLVVLLEDDELAMRDHLQAHVEATFSRLWNDEEDDVWNDYL